MHCVFSVTNEQESSAAADTDVDAKRQRVDNSGVSQREPPEEPCSPASAPNHESSDAHMEEMAHVLLKEVINAPRSINWSLKDDAILLVHHWHDTLNECSTRWHVKGHSPCEATTRLQELKVCLSRRVYDLWPDAPAVERDALRPMLSLLTSAAGRQQLIAEMDAEHAAEDVAMYNTDAAPWIDELEQFHDGDDVAALITALDDLPRRHAGAGSFTRNDDLELICKVQRVHHSEGQLLQKDITIGNHASDDGCRNCVHELCQSSGLSESLAREFLPKYGSSGIFAAELDRRVSAAMLDAIRSDQMAASARACRMPVPWVHSIRQPFTS